MELSELVTESDVRLDLDVSSKKHLLDALASELAAQTNLEHRLIFETLMEREQLGSTGLGGGVAIPHGKLDGLQDVVAFVVRLKEPIDFDAADDEPIDICICLLAPEESNADHLKVLSKVSRLMRDQSNLDTLRTAETPALAAAVFSSAGGQTHAA